MNRTEVFAPTDNVQSGRILWVDSAKGLGISLVVFGHVLGGVLARQWLDSSGVGREIYDYIYLFHMPLFFIVSGFFFIEQVRLSPIKALTSRIGAIAWPYFFWDFAVRISLLPLISVFMSAPPLSLPLSEWITKALVGELSWFLWTLFVMQIVLIPLSRIPVWILFVASTAICLNSSSLNLGFFQPVVYYMPYLLFGAMIRPLLGRFEIPGNGTQLMVALSAFAVVGVVFLMGWSVFTPIAIVCGISASFACIFLVQCFGDLVQTRLLAPLGAASLAIYVLHPYFQGAAREALIHVIGRSPIWQLTVPAITAIAGPFSVWALAQRFGCPWLFRVRLHIPSAFLSRAA